MFKARGERRTNGNIGRLVQQLQYQELPMLEEIIEDITAALGGNGNSRGRDESDEFSDGFGRSRGMSRYNRIPGTIETDCKSVLLVYCWGWNQFSERLKQISKHVAVLCPETEQVYFVTDAWLPKQWKEHEYTFMAMRANMTVMFHAMGDIVLLEP